MNAVSRAPRRTRCAYTGAEAGLDTRVRGGPASCARTTWGLVSAGDGQAAAAMVRRARPIGRPRMRGPLSCTRLRLRVAQTGLWTAHTPVHWVHREARLVTRNRAPDDRGKVQLGRPAVYPSTSPHPQCCPRCWCWITEASQGASVAAVAAGVRMHWRRDVRCHHTATGMRRLACTAPTLGTQHSGRQSGVRPSTRTSAPARG